VNKSCRVCCVSPFVQNADVVHRTRPLYGHCSIDIVVNEWGLAANGKELGWKSSATSCLESCFCFMCPVCHRRRLFILSTGAQLIRDYIRVTLTIGRKMCLRPLNITEDILSWLDTTRSTCRAHAFWLCRHCQTAQLDSLDTPSSTGLTWREWLAA